MKEHLWCRSEGKSSLFDVSHMGQIRWHGKDRVKFLERVVVGDIGGLGVGSGCLSLVTNKEGGILDDTVITKYEDYVYMVRLYLFDWLLFVDCSLWMHDVVIVSCAHQMHSHCNNFITHTSTLHSTLAAYINTIQHTKSGCQRSN